MTQFTIGADPELFVQHRTSRKFVSAHNLIPGTKARPFEVEDGAIQVDGVAAEFNINPVSNREDFRHRLRNVMRQLQDKIWKQNEMYDLAAVPTAYFEKEYFDGLPKKARLLGCQPDYNAYLGKANPPPATKEPFRTGSGHVHIGWTRGADLTDPQHLETCRSVVRQLDATVYSASLSWDSDTKRRELYGKMGAFRPCMYGVEYRPLSNAYLNHDSLILEVYDRTVEALELLWSGTKLYKEDDIPEEFRYASAA